MHITLGKLVIQKQVHHRQTQEFAATAVAPKTAQSQDCTRKCSILATVVESAFECQNFTRKSTVAADSRPAAPSCCSAAIDLKKDAVSTPERQENQVAHCLAANQQLLFDLAKTRLQTNITKQLKVGQQSHRESEKNDFFGGLYAWIYN